MAASLALEGQATATGVTTFQNEACDGVEAIADYVPSSLIRVSRDLQDLKAYFQRPRLIQSGSLTFGARSLVNSYQVSNTTLATAFPQWANRLSGAYGVRFKTCFRLQVAATAFHQGLITASFQYQAAPGSAYTLNRAVVPQLSTNLPHARLDLSESTMVELQVPFLYPLEFMTVVGSDYVSSSLGVFGINTVLPAIAVTGLVAPSYKLYIWLEDMELFGADNNASTVVTLQSGQFPLVKELKESKLLSSSMDQGAKIANFVSRHVPMLSALSGPTEWALGIASGVAKYFGFARPLVQEPVLRVNKQLNVGEGQVDLPFSGQVIGPFQSNTLAFSDTVGGSNVDEMSLKYVFSNYSQICVGSVNVTNVHGNTVYATSVGMPFFWFRAPALGIPFCNIKTPVSTSSAVGNSIQHSTLSYYSSFYRQWRGTIVFRFTFAKTKFHGGRYLVSYNPLTSFRDNLASSSTTVQGPEVVSTLVQPYGYSTMIDLRDGNVFEFEVPYMLELPWVNFASETGGLTMTCIDPLQASASVTTLVPFLVEVKGGRDFEVADFAGTKFLPYSAPTYITQSGEFGPRSETSAGTSAKVKSSTLDPSQLTMGEKHLSLKQAIQIPYYQISTVNTGVNNGTIIPPWYYNNTTATLGGTATSPIPAATTFFGCGHHPSAIALGFVFARGGTDCNVISPTAPSGGFIVSMEQYAAENFTGAPSTTLDYTNRINGSSTPKVIGREETFVHGRSPAYQSVSKIPVTYGANVNFTRNLGSAPGFDDGFHSHYLRLRTTNSSAATQTVYVSTGAADDAQLLHFIGPPAVLIPNALGSGNLFPDWYS